MERKRLLILPIIFAEVLNSKRSGDVPFSPISDWQLRSPEVDQVIR